MQQQEKSHPSVWERIPRSFWYSVIFMGVYAVIYLVASEDWMNFSQLSSLSSQLVQNAGSLFVLSSVLTVLLSLVGITKYRRKREERSADLSLQCRFHVWLPLLFSTSLLLVSLGNIINAYNYAHNIFAIPSWADIAVLASFPLQIIGILLLPMRSLPGRVRRRIMLDSLMVVAALVTFSWYFLLGPLLLYGTERSVLAIATNLAFPCLTLLLTSCLILFTVFTPRGSGRLTVGLLCVGVAISTMAGTIHQYNELHSGPLPFTWIALGWMLGGFLIALAAQSMRWLPVGESTSKEPAQDKQTVPMWRTLLPYLLLPVVLGLVLYVWETDRSSPLALGTYSCSLLLLVLIFGKQIIVIREIHWLNGGLQAAQHTLQQANARLEGLATTDPLTELPNHRALLESLEKETAGARRYGHPFSVLFFDGDHFKRVNDTHGHSVGDAVLQELGRRVRDGLRGGDTIGRYGGEEFLVLLPQTDTTQACEVAERMRVAIAAHPLALGLVEGGINLTISIGAATFPTDGHSGSEVVNKADQAMYWAKRLGRNQIRTALEAERASQDSALAATLQNLERRDAPSLDGLSVEQAVRAHQLTTIQSLMGLLDLRDQGISAHSYQVSDLAAAIAQELGMEQEAVFAVSTSGLLHDVGKIAIPDLLLQKAGTLSANEWALIKQHPELGAQILEVSPYLHHLMPAVGHHHENWDGTGYPDRLAGEHIPLAARILRVSEAYWAMLTTRSYQAGRSAASARSELLRCSATHFDPAVVQAALRVLSSGEHARDEATSRPASSSDERARPGEKSAARP